MRMTELITIGFDLSYGDAEYRCSMAISDLTAEKMNQLRAVIPVALWQMEEIWKLSDNNPMNQAAVALNIQHREGET